MYACAASRTAFFSSLAETSVGLTAGLASLSLGRLSISPVGRLIRRSSSERNVAAYAWISESGFRWVRAFLLAVRRGRVAFLGMPQSITRFKHTPPLPVRATLQAGGGRAGRARIKEARRETTHASLAYASRLAASRPRDLISNAPVLVGEIITRKRLAETANRLVVDAEFDAAASALAAGRTDHLRHALVGLG